MNIEHHKDYHEFVFLQNLEQNHLQHFNQIHKQELEIIKQEDIIYIDNPLNLPHPQQIGILIGVDIEQSYKLGYDGRICLIQMKINRKNYIIDALKLKDDQTFKEFLVHVFQSTNIKKIFYGGQSDILWLQRDYQIIVQNFCDLKDLAELLDRKVDNSLTGLWNRFANLNFSKEEKKQLQQSDWMMRPLSNKQLEYAALDCHYLPYIWFRLVGEVLEKKTKDEIIKLQQKFLKIKPYQKTKQNRYQFIKAIDEDLDETLEDFDDYYNTNEYTEFSVNQKQLIKFIFSELCLCCQEYAFFSDQPSEDLDDEEQLLIASVVLLKMLEIPKLNEFPQQSLELKEYKNQNYELRKQDFKPDRSYLEWKNYICNGFMNALQTDENFVKWALTEIFLTESLKTSSQDKSKQKQERAQTYNTANKEVFGQCKILAPNNMLLCNCAEKKGQWYIKNKRAVLVQENPMIIKLLFEPSGFEIKKKDGDEETTEKEFYTIERINQCVVCGSKQNLLKYNIIPPQYKQHFPHQFKTAKTHGFVLLCTTCQLKANAAQDLLKEKIALDYGVPIKEFTQQSMQLKKIAQLKKLCSQYQVKCQQYPKDVRKKFKNQIRDLLKEIYDENEDIKNKCPDLVKNKENRYKISSEFFKFINDLDTYLSVDKKDIKNAHGQKVVEQLKTDQDFENFIELWKKNFLDALNPQFLPDAWYIDGKPRSSQQVFLQLEQE